MGTTTMRVDSETHARLMEMSKATGLPLIDTVRDAVEALHLQRFARQVIQELADLRSDPAAWQAYLDEAESTAVGFGITRRH